MKKVYTSKVATFVGFIVMALGALAICTVFLPYLGSKVASIIGDTERVTVSGMEFVKCLFEGNKIESILTGEGNIIVKMLMGNKELSAATYTVEIGAVIAVVGGALMLVFGLFYMLSKARFMRSLTAFGSFLAFAGGLSAMIAAIVIGKKLSVDAGIVSTVVSVSAGSIVAMCAGLLGCIGMSVVKK